MFQLSQLQQGVVAAALWDLLAEIVAVIEFDPGAGYPFVHINAAFETSTGWSRDDVVGRPMGELQRPEVVNQFVQHGHEALAKGVALEYQVHLRTASGGRQIYHVLLRPLPELRAEGPPLLLSVMTDVTALTRTLEALTETQRLAHIGHWWWDVEADEIHWSSEMYRLYGLDRDHFDPSYAGYLDRLADDERERVDASIRTALETGEPFEIEHRVVLPDGTARHVWARGQVTRDSDGHPVRLAGTSQDITDRRIVEDALTRTEVQLRAVLDHASEHLWLVDPEGLLVEVNQAPLAIAGVHREDVVGRPLGKTPWWAGDPDDRLRDDIEAALAGRETSGRGRYVTADGTTRGLERTVAPVRDAAGAVVYVLVKGRDVAGEATREVG